MIRLIVISISILLLSGCASVVENSLATQAQRLSSAMQNHEDPETVIQAMPSYLLLLDSLAEQPDAGRKTLISASSMYTAYSSLLSDQNLRVQRLTSHSLNYANRALCLDLPDLCITLEAPFAQFEQEIQSLDFNGHTDVLYNYVQTLGLWIQARTDNWDALAKVARVRLLSEKLYAIDKTMDKGGLSAILGLLNSLLPPSYGGKPEVARDFFEKSIVISQQENLSYKVMFAQFYARLVFDQDLHDKLLKEVIAADAGAGNNRVVNILAQKQAAKLLEQSSEYF